MSYETKVDGQTLAPERQLLLDAAQYMREHGWCQGSVRDGRSVCAIGALIGAEGNDGWHKPLSQTALGSITLMTHYLKGNNETVIPIWNDAADRTKGEVIAALEAAAFHNLGKENL